MVSLYSTIIGRVHFVIYLHKLRLTQYERCEWTCWKNVWQYCYRIYFTRIKDNCFSRFASCSVILFSASTLIQLFSQKKTQPKITLLWFLILFLYVNELLLLHLRYCFRVFTERKFTRKYLFIYAVTTAWRVIKLGLHFIVSCSYSCVLKCSCCNS